ncbi:polysaccharide deacetylase family protein [Hymenobacter saemangeumensis]|uniref:Polysaccharide deacetylase family protein n=1 Tax=Hymenobacter saemangeumensis TaxID=1084522 RepID=A0ABP8IU18_9BACT
MLSYRTARLALAGSVLALGSLAWAGLLSYWWLLLPLALYLGAVAYGSSVISSSFFIETDCGVATAAPEIALTFDDGPIEPTRHILAVLRKHEAPAAFFCIGRRVMENPAILRQIDAEGHIVGNHTYSHHALLDFFSRKKLLAELEETGQAVQQAIGKKPRWFRPPYGVTTPNLAFAIRALGLACIGWNVRSMDTVAQDEQKLLHRLLAALKPGAVFLLHDSSAATASILDTFIQEAKNRGFKIVSPSHLLCQPAYD